MLLWCVSCLFTPDPKQVLLNTLEHYATLKSFSMRIEQNNASGLYPGTYSQSFKWMKGGRFEMIVTTRPVFDAATKRKVPAPNYYASGGSVTSISPTGARQTSPIDPAPNSSPGWEVCGGPIVSYLQGTPMKDMLSKPPSGMEIVYSDGTDKTFAGRAVRDVQMRIAMGSRTSTIHWFVDANFPHLLGWSYDANNSEHGGAKYLDQVENPNLPASLGDPPK